MNKICEYDNVGGHFKFCYPIGGYFINYIFFTLQLSSVYSEINCYNENYNFNETFEYDNSVMLIWAVFGLNKHQKYIQRY